MRSLISQLRLWLFPAVVSLILAGAFFPGSSAFAQEITVLDPAIVYKNCLEAVAASGNPPESCRTNFRREAEYSDCLAQTATLPSPSPAILNCTNTYVGNVVTDHLNLCLSTHPEDVNGCQNHYSSVSNFAGCIGSFKNPVDCEKIYGYKKISTVRNAAIPSGAIPGINPFISSVGTLVANGLQIVFVFSVLVVLIYLVFGAFRWITSGGDKEAIGKARGTITSALVGLAILALAFFITTLSGEIVGINILNLPEIPTLDQQPSVFRQ